MSLYELVAMVPQIVVGFVAVLAASALVGVFAWWLHWIARDR